MHNISILNGNLRGLSADEFLEHMQSIAYEHRRSNKAKAFAFIVANESNPHMQKILHDFDYWNSLNQISGKNLTIFYLSFSNNRFEIAKRQKSVISPTLPTSQSRKVADTEVNSLDSEEFMNILASGNDYGQISLPGILFFQTDGENVLASEYVKLNDGKGVEELYQSLSGYMKDVSKSLSNIQKENIYNYDAVFRELLEAVGGRKRNEFINKISLTVLINSVIKVLFHS